MLQNVRLGGHTLRGKGSIHLMFPFFAARLVFHSCPSLSPTPRLLLSLYLRSREFSPMPEFPNPIALTVPAKELTPSGLAMIMFNRVGLQSPLCQQVSPLSTQAAHSCSACLLGLLRGRSSSRNWRYNSEQNRQQPCPHEYGQQLNERSAI